MQIGKYEELSSQMLEKISNANVFFQENYVFYVRDLNEELYYCFDDERIIPVRYRKKAIFKFAVLISEPFVLVDEVVKDLKDFLNEVLDILSSELGVQWCNSTASCFFDDTPSRSCKRIPFGSHVINLKADEEELWKHVHGKHRNVIRKSEKEGVFIRIGGEELLNDYAKLESETTERTGRVSSGYNYYLKQVKLLRDNIKIYIAYYDDIPQAGGIFYVNQTCCYYMYGATKANSIIGAANLLLWTAIKDAKEEGVHEFSFVGCRINEDPCSKYHGIQRFKERFGGELRTGYMFRCEKSEFMYKLFCRAMQVKLKKNTPYTTPIDDELYKWADIQEKEKW